MKKISLFLILVFLTLTLSACSGDDHIELTEKESNAIAQYGAYLLLKYDRNYNNTIRLLERKDLQAVLDERRRAEEALNPSPTPTEAPTVIDEPSTEGEGQIPEAEPTDIPEPEVTSIAEAGGIEGFDIGYAGYSITDSYLSDGDFYSFSAPEGKQLCVVEFDVVNTQAEEAEFFAGDYELAYRIRTESGSFRNSTLSLLMNDLQTLRAVIPAGGSVRASLIFEVYPDEVPLYLEVTGDKQFIIDFN